jgi:hypothetical protein
MMRAVSSLLMDICKTCAVYWITICVKSGKSKNALCAKGFTLWTLPYDFHHGLVSRQNLPITRYECACEFGRALTKNYTMKRMRQVKKNLRTVNKSSNLSEMLQRAPKRCKLAAIPETPQWLGIDHCGECRIQHDYCSCLFEPHSGTPNDSLISTVPKNANYENVQFSEQVDPYLLDLDSSVDPTRRLQDTNDASLENFFSRPIKIYEAEWATSTTLGFTIDPWSLYWDNARVSNRVANYSLLRANMKVKVVINGNGFQYGRALVAYLPFDVYDQLSTNSALVPSDLVGTSQLPHFFLDPCTSAGGEMKLPMFNYQNYIEIAESQWSELGSLYVRSLNDLKHANGANDVVTISVFAWAEDVAMSVLTSVEPDTIGPQSGFEPQSGEIEEANKTGMISGPATTVAKWAAYLTKVPYIGPFATATQMGASTTAAIAKMFGYCRPPVTKNPEPYRPTPISSLALTNTPDTAQKMTVDSLQELSIDPRISGIGGVDPMNIREIAKRESYLTKFSWPIGTTPETLLWNSRVDPVIWAEDTGPPVSFHFPACAFAALPFQHWTGTMKFRFQIVASTFHKGRIKVVYDPNYLASNEYNTNYMRIIDIAEEQDFTIEVGQGQERTLLNHHYPGVDSVTQMYGSTVFTSKEAGNGVLGIYIVNELTTPNSTTNNDIEINVFVSMGEDFEVFVPEDHFQKFVSGATPQSGDEIDDFEPQSGVMTEMVPDGQNTSEPSAPQQSLSTTVGLGESANPLINQVFTGEAITSFRTMLKRYNLWSTIAQLDTQPLMAFGRYPHFPYLRGAVAGAVDSTGAAAGYVPYNYCNTIMLHWVRNAFQGWRGSIRYKLIPRGNLANSDSIQVQRAPWKPSAPAYSESATSVNTYTSVKSARAGAIMETAPSGEPDYTKPFSGVNGTVLTMGTINPNLEFEMPYYSSFRFSPGKPSSYTGSQLFSTGWDYRINFNGNTSSVYDIYTAAGEDFQVYFFTGLPRMYYEASPPS